MRARASIASEHERIEVLLLRIARLVRHRGFDRTRIVSAMLLKDLPTDAAYDWRGETVLRDRIAKAALDETTMKHLIAGTRWEIAMIEERAGI